MDFYVGMKFADYPAGVVDWCNKHKKVITDNLLVDGVRQFCIAEPEVPPITTDDYDRAMEDHLLATRVARGYTLREPSPTYDDSPNVRWASDAADWKVFFTTVMEYGLAVQNHYAATGEAPTLEEFKNNLPNIVWTYNDDNNNNGDETE